MPVVLTKEVTCEKTALFAHMTHKSKSGLGTAAIKALCCMCYIGPDGMLSPHIKRVKENAQVQSVWQHRLNG